MQILTDAINGTTKLLNATELADADGNVIGSDVTVGEHFWGMIATNVATAVAVSKVTRSRVAQGKEAIAGILL
jgi:hypothetical protein